MNTHIYFLLDRSGSMSSMADDVIGGFNTFLREQQADGDDARMTVIQFDSAGPFEVIADGAPIPSIPPLTPYTFEPRGSTPLLDATARTILHAAARQARRAERKAETESVLVVTFTDGFENASRAFGKHDVLELVEAKKQVGWTFAFLGAGLETYAEADRVGVAVGSTQAFSPDAQGAQEAFASLSRSTHALRDKRRRGEVEADQSFWLDKNAEADLIRRSK